MDNNELTISLRVKALLDEASKQLVQFKADVGGLHTAVDAGAASNAKAAATANALGEATAGASKATTQGAAAADKHAAANTAEAAAAGKAAAANDALAKETTAAAQAAAQAAAAAEKQAAAERAAAAAAAEEAAELRRLILVLQGATPAAERLAAAQATLDGALASGAISQERHTALLAVATQRWGENTEAVRRGGISAAQTAAAMRMLPAQITDITTSLAGGMPLWLIAVQQGGQIKDSFGGIGPAARQIASLFTIGRVAAGGLGVALGAVALAAYQGAQEMPAYERALILSGNAAGETGDRLAAMAGRIDGVVGTQAQAAALLTTIAGSGKVAADNIEEFTIAALKMERAGGPAAEKTAEAFIALGKDPLTATLKLNEGVNFLTARVYEQIKALVEQGRTTDAAAVAQKAYADAMTARTPQLEATLGTLERAWRSVKSAAAEAWDAMLSIGRQAPLDSQIQRQADTVKQLEQEIERRRAAGAPTADLQSRVGVATNRLQDLTQDREEQASLARTQGETVKVRNEYLAAQKAVEQYADKGLSKQDLLNKKLKEYGENVKKINAGRALDGMAPLTDQEVKRSQDGIRKEVMGQGAQGPSAFSQANADAAVSMAQLKANFSMLQASVRAGDAIIVQALQDGNVSIDDAYNARLAQMRTESAAQRALLQGDLAEIDDALKKAKNGSESGPLRQKRVEVEAQIKLLDSNLSEESRKLGLWKTEQERQLGTITARVRVEVANLTGNFDRDAVQAQLKAQLQGDYEAAGRLATPDQTSAQRARLDMLVQSGTAQAEFNSKIAEATRLQNALSVQEQAVQVLQQTGAISALEAEGRIAEARSRQAPQLQAIVVQLQAMRDAMPTDAAVAIDAMNASIGQLQNTVTAATPEVVNFGTKAKNIAIDGLANAAGNAVANFKSLRSIINSTLKQIAGDIVSSGVRSALVDQFKVSSGSSGGSGGGGLWSAIGTLAKGVLGYAAGGRIQGPGTGTSDSIPALVDGVRPIAVSNNEFIQPEKAVRHYGLGFMEAVRSLKLPKPQFAFGGLVQAHQRARFATGGQVTGAMPPAGAAVPMQINLTNTGTPQRVQDASATWNGKEMVTSIVLADLQSGGLISQSIDARRG